MNAIGSGNVMLSKWALAAIAATAMIIFTVVLWATSAKVEPSAKVDIDRSSQSAKYGAGPTIGYENPPPQTYIPPVPNRMPSTSTQMPLYGGSSGAVVKVTPVRSLPPLQASKQVVSKPSNATKAAVATRDMFPVGNILKDKSEAPIQEKAPDEVFPSFDYEGKLWQYTGRFASVDQLDIKLINLEVDGRKVYTFVDSTESSDVLFVQSTQDPNKYAIYR